MSTITVRISTVLTVISLSGCAMPLVVSMGLGAGSVAVNETTGKTTTDHIVSAVNGRDCRVSRIGKEDVCQDENQIKIQVTTTGVTPSKVSEIESRYRQ